MSVVSDVDVYSTDVQSTFRSWDIEQLTQADLASDTRAMPALVGRMRRRGEPRR